MPRGMAVLLACLVVTMIGFGVTLPVLPFFVERLAGGRPGSPGLAVQVGLLTAVLPLMQLVAAPLWGRWSDAVGRKRLVLVGIGGTALGQVLFGLAPTLAALYGARIVGGLLSAAILPAATAYVADITTPSERGRGMAWLGTAVSLGVIAGPALGGLLVRRDFHWQTGLGHLEVTGFSLPFLASAALALLALLAALRWLPESRQGTANSGDQRGRGALRQALAHRELRLLLALGAAGQLGLASFETTFALYAQRMWAYGPAQVGMAFMICGLVMAVSQTGLAALLASRVSEIRQVAAGFALTGVGLGLILAVHSMPAVLATVAIIALGNAFLAPNLAAMVSRRGASATGAVLGTQSAVGSFGQLGGTLAGAVLFSWNMTLPFALSGGLLLALGTTLAWRTLRVPAVDSP